jgi:hypothetical protein
MAASLGRRCRCLSGGRNWRWRATLGVDPFPAALALLRRRLNLGKDSRPELKLTPTARSPRPRSLADDFLMCDLPSMLKN